MAQPPPATTKAPVQHRKLYKKGLFAKDLGAMMYGFGDDYNSAPDTIAVMEELVIDHITDICLQASRIASSRGRIKLDDFRFALRHDPKKLARLEELLFMQEEIARARRGFENPMDYAVDEEGLLDKDKSSAVAAPLEPAPPPASEPKKAKNADKSKKNKGKDKA
ncbi:Taf13p [Sporobolomyces koalae]|uniref:Taf13p n=1 Tax=Sporobolomyces koalae TaxID=500713 RepID=UPI00317E6295